MPDAHHRELRVVPFSPLHLETEVAQLSRRTSGVANKQTLYLASFLSSRDPPAKCFVVESPYIDRHYLEEFSSYYSTSFRPPEARAARLHFFAKSMDQARLESLFAQAAGAAPDCFTEASAVLQAEYLGFVVVRPIPDAPIGRTILRTYDDSEARIFATSRTQRAHLGSFPLTIEGVPFQQQEVAVGACATTAIWSALASAARVFGSRAPTPVAVTEAATRHLINDRPVPAESGLDFQQIVGGIRALGFAPYAMRPRGPEFDISVRCYLNSGLPVILFVKDAGDNHAFTLVGFRRATSTCDTSDPGKGARNNNSSIL